MKSGLRPKLVTLYKESKPILHEQQCNRGGYDSVYQQKTYFHHALL